MVQNQIEQDVLVLEIPVSLCPMEGKLGTNVGQGCIHHWTCQRMLASGLWAVGLGLGAAQTMFSELGEIGWCNMLMAAFITEHVEGCLPQGSGLGAVLTVFSKLGQIGWCNVLRPAFITEHVEGCLPLGWGLRARGWATPMQWVGIWMLMQHAQGSVAYVEWCGSPGLGLMAHGLGWEAHGSALGASGCTVHFQWERMPVKVWPLALHSGCRVVRCATLAKVNNNQTPRKVGIILMCPKLHIRSQGLGQGWWGGGMLTKVSNFG